MKAFFVKINITVKLKTESSSVLKQKSSKKSESGCNTIVLRQVSRNLKNQVTSYGNKLQNNSITVVIKKTLVPFEHAVDNMRHREHYYKSKSSNLGKTAYFLKIFSEPFVKFKSNSQTVSHSYKGDCSLGTWPYHKKKSTNFY